MQDVGQKTKQSVRITDVNADICTAMRRGPLGQAVGCLALCHVCVPAMSMGSCIRSTQEGQVPAAYSRSHTPG